MTRACGGSCDDADGIIGPIDELAVTNGLPAMSVMPEWFDAVWA
jgi:hypothetical protein